uniref:Peptidase A1 domain-containing protein n=1 Tax=Ananas comosus var. bracteatus TaxID=296719 RepID=A0A6V7NRB5_ANACO|nr:unnamed protein product [Ananas comosus var. bracteatus]
MKHIKMPPPKPTTLLFLLLHLFSAAPFTAPAIDYHRVNLRDIASPNSPPPRRGLRPQLRLAPRPRRGPLEPRLGPRRIHYAPPIAEYYHVDDFGSEVVSGLDEGSGEYFVRVGVGSPPKDQYLVVDSGSDVIWVQCQPCAQCYAQSDPVFDPAESSSFAGISCDSPICGLLRSDKGRRRRRRPRRRRGAAEKEEKEGGEEERCRYEVTYGDGSYTRGVLALETLTFGGSAEVGDVAIGCGQQNRGLFVGAAGLLGLGWGPMSLVGQLGGAAGGAFSYCLVTRSGASGSSGSTGSLVLGRTAAVPVGAVWVPLARNPRAPSFYYVGRGGARGRRGAAAAPGRAVPARRGRGRRRGDGHGHGGDAPPRRRLRRAARRVRGGRAGAPASARVSIFDACYDLSGYESVRVPTVSFYFATRTRAGRC